MITKVVSLALAAAPAAAHLAFWHPSMYGYDDDNSAYPMGYPDFVPFSNWWFHGQINQPPADGQFFELPAGGQAQAQVACNKQWTTWGGYQGTPSDACPDDFGSLHEASTANTKGCAIAIAYKSDVNDVKPEDFVVITTNAACPWNRDVTFDIPAGLPACPEGGCHCMWGWVHGETNGGDEMYMNGFKCQVTNPGNRALATPKAPVLCTSGNCSGAKNPLYFSKVEGANVQRDDGPPSYNERYGWTNGAQTDIFADGVVDNSQPTTTASNTATTPTATDDSNNETPETTSTTTESQPAATGGGGRHHKHNRPNRWNNWGNNKWWGNDDSNDDDSDNNDWDNNKKRGVVYSREN